MRRFMTALFLLVPLAACTTPKTPEEAQAQRCQLDTGECESRIRKCQDTGNELICKDQDHFCKDVRARCPGY